MESAQSRLPNSNHTERELAAIETSQRTLHLSIEALLEQQPSIRHLKLRPVERWSISTLPTELIQEIFSWMDPASIAFYRLLSRHVNAALSLAPNESSHFVRLCLSRHCPKPTLSEARSYFPSKTDSEFLQWPCAFQDSYARFYLRHLLRICWSQQLQFPSRLTASFGILNQLTSLQLCSCFMYGPFPVELTELTSLETLILDDNTLDGPLPSSIGEMTSLLELSVNSNRFSGSIPASLSLLSNLIYLNLGNNEFTGNIPAQLGQLKQLQELHLYVNHLAGPIPVELCSLINLQKLDLHDNALSGTIPHEIHALKKLNGINLTCNNLSGAIPATIGLLPDLKYLLADRNAFTGRIPPEIGQLVQLRHLHLRENQLSGEIPVEIGRLENLWGLLLSSNRLEGLVPAELRSMRCIIQCDLRNNAGLKCDFMFDGLEL
ncbi:hypothetical protein CcCBS67573_g10572 [Chytriomyces confervae]|uniref:non-specific serine/threonine protein kinase n=1 Tax=Chytriomyces confervae TaxID=246404 RepID=A0A507CQU7_9FUNG|nr:hypothetical protein CcCBS67573_g10572 [Chytriomyces confervae]